MEESDFPKRQSALKYESAIEGCGQLPSRMTTDKNPESIIHGGINTAIPSLKKCPGPNTYQKFVSGTQKVRVVLIPQSALIKNRQAHLICSSCTHFPMSPAH